MSSSKIAWLEKLIRFIEDDDGMEAWMKKYLANVISVMETLIRQAGQAWIAAVTAKIISVNSEQISGEEKLKKVLTAMKDEGIATVSELSNSGATTLINAIVTDLKSNGVIS